MKHDFLCRILVPGIFTCLRFKHHYRQLTFNHKNPLTHNRVESDTLNYLCAGYFGERSSGNCHIFIRRRISFEDIDCLLHSLEIKTLSFWSKYFLLFFIKIGNGDGRMGKHVIQLVIGNYRRVFIISIPGLLNVGRVCIAKTAHDFQDLRDSLFDCYLYDFHYVIVLFSDSIVRYRRLLFFLVISRRLGWSGQKHTHHEYIAQQQCT